MLSHQAKSALAPRGRLVLQPLFAAGEPINVVVEDGVPAAVTLARDSLWEVSTELPGWWAKKAALRIPADASEHVEVVKIWPEAFLAGRLVLSEPGQKAPPKELTLAFGSLGGRLAAAATPEDSAACPVNERLEFRCAVPAARLDAAVRVKGFVPHYRWDLQLAAGKTLTLGQLPLRAGASLVGKVETIDGDRSPGRGGSARLLPLQAPGPGGALAERLQATATEAPLNATGFFQLTDLRPGTYVLEVQSPGYAPARVSPVEIEAGLETTIALPVVLSRPVRLEIALNPALDWLNRPWRVELYGTSAITGGLKGEPVYNAAASSEGLVTLPGQENGRYLVTVSDSLGNRLLSEFFEVTGPADARRDFEIEVVTVEATVKLGSEPLRATLWFGGERGAVSVKMESNEKGELVGILPRDGFWLVAVKSDTPEVSSHQRVEIRADKLGKAEVEITIPDTRVFGRVVAEDGRPVPEASVDISTPLWGEDTTTDEKGEFTFRGLPEGAAQLAARAGGREGKATSDWSFVTLSDRQEVGPIELRLRRVKSFRGRVESIRGPVAGATLGISPARPLLGFGDQERTALDGSFEAEIPGASEVLHVTVSAPGLALKTFEIPETGQPVVLFLTDQRGTVKLEVPYTDDEATERDLRLLVFQNGVPLSSTALGIWAQAQGVRPHEGKQFVFPGLAPGSYRACIAPRGALPDWALGGWSDRAACASGELGNGDVLNLVVPGARGPSEGARP